MMGWLGRLFGTERRQAAAPRDPVLAEWLGATGSTATGVSVTPETALRCPPVYAAVNLLADTVGTIPLDLFERTGADSRERATGHPLHGLLHDAPNDWQTSAEFRQMLMTHLNTHGNGYASIVWRGDGVPESLEPMHPSAVRVYRTNGRIAYRHQPADGPARTLLPGEVLHLKRRPFKRSLIEGESPVVLHRETIGLALAVVEYLARFIGNSAVPRGAIEVPGTLDEPAAAVLRASWERRHQGLGNAHRIAILDGGMKFHELGMTNEDAQLVDTYRTLIAELARIFGVPLHLIGEVEKSTSWGTGIEQQSIGFIVYFVRPWLVTWEQALNRALLTAESRKRYFFEFNVDGLLRGDFKTRMEGFALMLQWGMATPNEVRRLNNMPPLPGGDSRLHPLNMAPAEKVMDVLLRDTAKATRALSDIKGEQDGH